MSGIPGRKGKEWRMARDQVLRHATHCQMPNCKFPGVPLDFDAKPRTPLYPSVDHIIPVSKTEGWSDAEKRAALNDPRFLRPAHTGCNSSRGAKPVTTRYREVKPSRDWGA